ncbi:LuxR C-terminal-related transcriptional regulator [Streptomyces sp. NPDC051104]|uniref:helix-turn-helix transcriptional regulator n=1 Tax=Streptomyces sp. NPDC051104 TaxID=3155044 RepID=UPI0034267EFC
MEQGLDAAYERMLSVATAALHQREPARLWPLMAATLPDVCGGEVLIYKLDDWSESAGTVGTAPEAASALDVLDDEALGLLRAGFPFAGHYANDRSRAPVTAGRVLGAAWSASATARLVGDALDMDHVLAIPLPEATTPITGCLVYRAGTDFTDDQLRFARRVQPLLAAVDQQRQLLESWQRLVAPGAPQDVAADCDLTPRETAVLLLLTEALTAAAIGRRLGISDRTVHKHIQNVYRKLGTRDRISTVLRAQQLGLVPAPNRPHRQRDGA